MWHPSAKVIYHIVSFIADCQLIIASFELRKKISIVYSFVLVHPEGSLLFW